MLTRIGPLGLFLDEAQQLFQQLVVHVLVPPLGHEVMLEGLAELHAAGFCVHARFDAQPETLLHSSMREGRYFTGTHLKLLGVAMRGEEKT
jgi:hypothetical protein